MRTPVHIGFVRVGAALPCGGIAPTPVIIISTGVIIISTGVIIVSTRVNVALTRVMIVLSRGEFAPARRRTTSAVAFNLAKRDFPGLRLSAGGWEG